MACFELLICSVLTNFGGQVLSHLLYLMRAGERDVTGKRDAAGIRDVPSLVVLALAHLCSPDDQRTIFIDNNGTSFHKTTS